jgi:hypothetical protein
LRILIIPSAEVFPDEDIATLSAWVRDGGTIIIAGECGRRLGESGNFEIAPNASTLAPLFGKDRVVRLKKDPGLDFYRASEKRPGLLLGLAKTISAAAAKPLLITAPEVSWKVALTPYRLGESIFVDVNNTDLDPATDILAPAAPVRFGLNIPPELRASKWKARVFAPDDTPNVNVKSTTAGSLEISLSPISVFASVLLEKE